MNDHKKKSRLWLSFSLRTALVLLTCFGIWLGWFVPRVQKQKRAAEWIRQLGGQPYYYYQLEASDWGIGYYPGRPWVVPTWLLSTLGIDCFYSIKNVVLADAIGVELSFATNLHDLRHLHLANTGITDLKPLRNLSRLECLWIDDNPIEDISALSKLKKLKWLYSRQTNLHDIEPLRKLVELERVHLANTNITDLSPLADHRKLFALDISHTKVFDISSLRTCKALIELDVSHTDVPDADIDSLQELLPNCKIVR